MYHFYTLTEIVHLLAKHAPEGFTIKHYHPADIHGDAANCHKDILKNRKCPLYYMLGNFSGPPSGSSSGGSGYYFRK